MIERELFSAVRIATFAGTLSLTASSGFLFQRAQRLFLVTSRHVLIDRQSGHHPDRIEFVLHTDESNLTAWTTVSMLLYRDGLSQWRQATDSGGEIDVAVLEVDLNALPRNAVLHPFREEDCARPDAALPTGTPVLVVGFPLGFYDTVHHLPVVRTGAIASAHGVRFQGEGFFLTDVRTHRGASGAPVVTRTGASGPRPWTLLGIHSGSLDMRDRREDLDERLGLGYAWYADVLRTLTN